MQNRSMGRRLSLATMLVLLPWLVAPPATRAAAPEPFLVGVHTNATGQTMPYRLLAPKEIVPQRRYPLVLFFHGAGERGTDNQRQLIHGTRRFTQAESREQFPCFVLAPQCPPGQQWVDMPWSGDSGARPAQPSAAMKLALEILDTVERDQPVDRQRLYVTGLSMGGYATWDCVTRFPDRFAAGVPVCGGGDETTVTAAVAKVPVWAFHSDDDGTVKALRTRNMIQAVKQAGGRPHYFEYFGLGHNSWDQAYAEPELLAWLFAQRLGQPDTYALRTPVPELPAVARWPQSDDVFPGKGPLQKADWFQKLWRERRLNWWNNRARDQGAVVFLGDSITQGWGTLAQDFPGFKVANRGISGDVTRGVRFRLKEDVLDLQPAAVVLLIGTNDLGLGGNAEDAAENVKALLAAFRLHNPKLSVVVCKVMPRQPQFAEKIQRLNQLVDDAMKGNPQFVRCDTWSLFADSQGGAKKQEFPDLLHPNGMGYVKWTEALKPILNRLRLAR